MVDGLLLAVVLGVYGPLAAGLASLVLGSLYGRRGSEAAGVAAGLMVAAAAAAAVAAPSGSRVAWRAPWPLSGVLAPVYGVDDVSKVFLVVLGIVSPLVAVYSLGYMGGDPGYRRYYAVLSLFMGSMAGLLMARSLGLFYAYWELVGLCSFTLIGHNFYSPRASRAAAKAFLVTRLGDLSLLAGLVLVYHAAGGLGFDALRSLPPDVGRLFAALASVAVVAKAAQLPLHVWLPDAMEGPTPVSALLHSATMVKAGAYLAALLTMVPGAGPVLHALALLALVTAAYASAAALAQVDAKRLLAYSTMANLGLIIAGVSAGAPLALLHVIGHGLTKALLFLAVGVPIHSLEPLYGPEVARRLDVLRGAARENPVLAASIALGSASLAGLPPLTGFYGKSSIAACLHAAGPLASVLLLAASLGSAAYSAKLGYYMLSRGPGAARPRLETRVSMMAPVAALTALLLAPPQALAPWLGGIGAAASEALAAVAGAGAMLGYYSLGAPRPPMALYRALLEGLYIDRFYTWFLGPALLWASWLGGYGLVAVTEEAEMLAASMAREAGPGVDRVHGGGFARLYAFYAIGLALVAIVVLVAAGWLSP